MTESATKPFYEAIYLSPHLDDAALSCGGQIAARSRRGERVLVATLAAGDAPGELTPLAKELHRQWKLDGSCAARREEDRRACALLGAEAWHGSIPDAVYRRHPRSGEPLYATLEAVFGPVHGDDPAMAEWERALRELPPAGEVIVPLGVGGHADHRGVRLAAAAVFGAAPWHYEDFPYAGKLFAVARTLGPRWRWRSRTWRLSAEDVRARCAAAAAYASQAEMLAGRSRSLDAKIERHVRRVGGERLWQAREPG
jgi:LmbE family N-acetylglucosaminyl deacetylase